MSKTPSAAAMAAEKVPLSDDKLDRVRAACREVRDIEIRKKNIEDTLKEINKQLYEQKRVALPELFKLVGISRLDLVSNGNLPAYEVRMEPYVRANISAEWDEERRAKAFEWLDKHGAGDLIKTTITVHLPRNMRGLAKKVQAALRKLKVPFEIGLTVPWNTLTAYVRELHDKNMTPPLDVLGAEIGEIVTFKPAKTGEN